MAGSPIGISVGIEGAHVVDLLEVDVGEDQLVVAAVDDGGAVGAGKHVGGGQGAECPQHRGLRAQGHLLPVTQQAWIQREKGLGSATTPQGKPGVSTSWIEESISFLQRAGGIPQPSASPT